MICKHTNLKSHSQFRCKIFGQIPVIYYLEIENRIQVAGLNHQHQYCLVECGGHSSGVRMLVAQASASNLPYSEKFSRVAIFADVGF